MENEDINKRDAKGKDSVMAGIQKVKECNIKITAKSRNGIRELKHYRWKMDRNGESLNKPIKMYDHMLDGVRYVVQTKLMVRKAHKSKIRMF
jgi:phage terminase large subunit